MIVNKKGNKKMSEALFERFNEMFDTKGLAEDVDNIGTSDFKEVPHGDYEVSIEKLELGESKQGLPQLKVWFKILTGDFKGQRIFMNQNVDKKFGLHNANEFMDSLQSGYNVVFEDFVQYGTLIASIFESIQSAEYHLAYGQNDKGYNTFTIVEKYTN